MYNDERDPERDYHIVPIRILTIGCPGTKGTDLATGGNTDDTSKGRQKQGGPAEGGGIVAGELINAKADENVQLEGVLTDVSNVNKFVKMYDKKVYDIFGGPFYFQAQMSSGSIMDCFLRREVVLRRITKVF